MAAGESIRVGIIGEALCPVPAVNASSLSPIDTVLHQQSAVQLGAGANTKLHHIPKLAAIEEVTVAAVANRSTDSAQNVAKEFGIQTVRCPSLCGWTASCSIQFPAAHLQATDNWRDIIDDPTVDAIVIGTWPYLHHTLVLAALQANKHVLTEARMVSKSCTTPPGSHLCLHQCWLAGNERCSGQRDAGGIPAAAPPHSHDRALPLHAPI